jgi:hypothetical protein
MSNLTRGELMETTAIGGLVATKTMTFDGATTNDPGDLTGTGNPATLFTVTGEVICKVIAVCTTNLAGATATLEVGTTGNTAAIIAQSTATDIDAGEFWHDATPDAKVELSSVAGERIIVNGADIIQTVGTADITSGVIRYLCIWKPISADGNVAAA